jgi:propanediol utilization protein
MKKRQVKVYNVMNANGVIVSQTYAHTPQEAQKYADKWDSGLTVSRRGKRHGIVFNAILMRSPINITD